MKIVFLGTSGSMPTQNRGSPALAIKRKGELFLFDCGEGTQQRMVAARLGFRRPTHIYISHLHGDHVLGLPGLLQTMAMLKRDRPLDVFGPLGLINFIEAFSLILGRPGFTIRIHEIESEGVIHNSREYNVSAIEADHDIASWSFIIEENPRSGKFNPDIVKSLGIPEGPLWKRLQNGLDIELEDGKIIRSRKVVGPPRKGRKIAYSGDTKPTGKFTKAVESAELLIHEATFDHSLIEKAKSSCHSTSVQAAEVARAAKVEKLVLTHISSRYTDPSILLEQAIEIFPNTILAEDLMVLSVAH